MAWIPGEPFLPTDRPRSWSLAVICALAALLVVAPLQFLLDDSPVAGLLSAAFIGLGALGGCSFVFYIVRSALGHYRGLQALPWREQQW